MCVVLYDIVGERKTGGETGNLWMSSYKGNGTRDSNLCDADPDSDRMLLLLHARLSDALHACLSTHAGVFQLFFRYQSCSRCTVCVSKEVGGVEVN